MPGQDGQLASRPKNGAGPESQGVTHGLPAAGRRTELLVSVRSAAEAEAALAGGAGLIDVKDPARGSLGRAGRGAVADVIRLVAGRRPVSAALGELRDATDLDFDAVADGLAYVKLGLSGCGNDSGRWQERLNAARGLVEGARPGRRIVAVAYADWQRAAAPSPLEVLEFAGRSRFGAFLVDTWLKDGTTLLSWLPADAVRDVCRRCRQLGMAVALAGSLGAAEMRALAPAGPEWFAVRGAACERGRRNGPVDSRKVRRLVNLISGLCRPATSLD